jgi:hypothetical protein
MFHIVSKLSEEGLASIDACERVRREMWLRNGWSEYERDLLILDDVAWSDKASSTKHWIEAFISCHLFALDKKQHDRFRAKLEEERIQSESDLRTRHEGIDFTFGVSTALRSAFSQHSSKSQGHGQSQGTAGALSGEENCRRALDRIDSNPKGPDARQDLEGRLSGQ